FGMPVPSSDMLFDEATSALDPKLVGEVLDTMPIPSIETADDGGLLMDSRDWAARDDRATIICRIRSGAIARYRARH
ncbi:hypothetical protein ACC689_36380, partial [Rhizobium ruizarguesonis]